MDVPKTWGDWLWFRDEDARNSLITHYLPLARTISGRRRNRTIPAGFGRDEAFACGSLGLVKAVHTYDPWKGKFSTWAYLKINGHVIDGLRGYYKHHASRLGDCDAVAGPDPLTMTQELQERWESFQRQLSAEDFLLLKMRFHHQMRMTGIEERTGITPYKLRRILSTICQSLDRAA